MDQNREIAKVRRKVSVKDQPTDFAYWRTQSHEARLACLEEIRREYHGWKGIPEQGLQRVYAIVKVQRTAARYQDLADLENLK